MKNLVLFLLVVAAVFFIACGNDAPSPSTPLSRFTNVPLHFGTESFIQQTNDCRRPSTCRKVDLQYPVAQAGKIAVRNTINEYIQQKYINSLVGVSPAQDSIADLHFAAQFFLQNFQTRQQLETQRSQYWQKYSTARVLHQTDKYVSLEVPINTRLDEHTVHTEMHLISFDTTRGFPIYLKDLVLQKEAFHALCQAALLQAQQSQTSAATVALNTSLAPEYVFKEKFAFGAEGIHCIYSPTEPSSSAKPLAFHIPYEKLDGILDLSYLKHS